MMESTHRLAIEYDVEQWGIWNRYATGEVKGYPREVPFYRLMRGRSVRSASITEDRVDLINAAMRRLRERCPDQERILRLRYVDDLKPSKIGKLLGLGETRVREVIRQGLTAIEWIVECTA